MMSTEVLETTQINNDFARDIKKGLTASQKFLPSKYLYNKRGDEIFQEIMAMPEYYLTRAEYEIFDTHKAAILQKFNEGSSKFQLVEFGAGDGLKTKVLLNYFLKQKTEFTYVPIDISANILEELSQDLKQQLPNLSVSPICDDYFRAIEQMDTAKDERKVVLFLGANIGNFDPEESLTFLQQISKHLQTGDRIMIGFDLKKDPQKILNAYYDHAGITASFKFNLLQRINDELDGNFRLDQFQYSPIYHPAEGTIKSYLVSKQEQDVELNALDLTIHFDAWEAIYMERSQKYTFAEIDQLAQSSGFKVVHNFQDQNKYFTDSVWEVV